MARAPERASVRWSVRDNTYAANVAQPLLDDELWPPLLRAIREARERLDIVQLLFDVDFRPPTAPPIVDLIERAATRGVRVHILVNENRAIPDSIDELRHRFEGTTVQVASLPMSPNVLHAKLVIADDEAFLIDAPFQQKYVDSAGHAYDHVHRAGAKPLHAVTMRLRGAAVARIAQIFASLWAGRPGPGPDPGPGNDDDAAVVGSQTVELAWTSPAGILGDAPHEGILERYERALANAERYVYIETQYFTSPRITQAIANALVRAPELEVIMLLNVHMDVPTYDAWQKKRLDALREIEQERLAIFALWRARPATHGEPLRQVYLHSKVAIVDDVWATIGSANLDSVSLHDAVEFPVSVPHNVELNAILLDGIDGAPATGAVASLRRRLWGEHLDDAAQWRAQAPPEGWRATWRAVADANLRAWHAPDARVGRVFPFDAVTTLRRELLSPPREAPS